MTTVYAEIEHFTQEELRCKCGCKRFNVTNEFLICLEAFRILLDLPMNVTSCCRCISHNKNIGGVYNSLHQCETKRSSACDFYCKDMRRAYELACKCEMFNEVIWYKSKNNFIHIGIDKNQKGNYHIIK